MHHAIVHISCALWLTEIRHIHSMVSVACAAQVSIFVAIPHAEKPYMLTSEYPCVLSTMYNIDHPRQGLP